MATGIGCINCSKPIEYLGDDEFGTERFNGFAWTDLKEDDKKFFCSFKCFKTFDFEGYAKGETFGPLNCLECAQGSTCVICRRQ